MHAVMSWNMPTDACSHAWKYACICLQQCLQRYLQLRADMLTSIPELACRNGYRCMQTRLKMYGDMIYSARSCMQLCLQSFLQIDADADMSTIMPADACSHANAPADSCHTCKINISYKCMQTCQHADTPKDPCRHAANMPTVVRCHVCKYTCSRHADKPAAACRHSWIYKYTFAFGHAWNPCCRCMRICLLNFLLTSYWSHHLLKHERFLTDGWLRWMLHRHWLPVVSLIMSSSAVCWRTCCTS